MSSQAITTVPADSPAYTGVNRWVIVWMSGFLLFAIGGIYAFSVFSGPLGELRGWSMAEMTFAYSLQSGILPIPMLLSGRMVDTGRARTAILIGGLMFAAGYAISGFTDSLLMFYLSFGVLAGIGDGIAYGAALNNSMKFFPDKRGTASGIVTGLYGLSSAWVGPVFALLIGDDPQNAPRALMIMGAVFAAVTVLVWSFVRSAPDGYMPPGWKAPEAEHNGRVRVSVTWRQMVRTPLFWVIFLMFVAGTFSGLMVTSQAVQIGVGMYGISPLVAASLFVPLIAVANGGGRFVFGPLSDAIGQVRALLVVFGGVVLSLLVLLATRGHATGFAVGVILLSLTFGGTVGVMPSLVMRNFGPQHQGVNYAVVFFAFSTAAIAGPMAGAFLGEGGDYTWAFVAAIGVALLGMALTVQCGRLMKRKRSREAIGLQPWMSRGKRRNIHRESRLSATNRSMH